MSTGENSSSQAMGKVLGALPFLASVTLKTADSWSRVGAFAERAGLLGLEILLRTPHAEKGVAMLKEHYPELRVGLGTVLTLDDFKRAEDVRADFVVSPGTLPELLERARTSGMAYLPGVMTPSEVMLLSREGFWNAKLFPAGYLIETYVKALEGPYPHMKYCVSGGISEDNWSFYAQSPSVRSISGTWIIPNEHLNDAEAESFIHRLEEKHFQFAKFQSISK
jgi:2-dehydro-3-deoxyphosphogluconate aldolase/(4S)-4-hydroxy-2-oxoglutarate aldolase